MHKDCDNTVSCFDTASAPVSRCCNNANASSSLAVLRFENDPVSRNTPLVWSFGGSLSFFFDFLTFCVPEKAQWLLI